MHQNLQKIEIALRQQRVNEALRLLEEKIDSSLLAYVGDDLTIIKSNYHYLTSYFLQNSSDPQRTEVLQKIMRKLWELLDTVSEMLYRKELHATFYQEQNNYFRKLHEPLDSLQKSIDSFHESFTDRLTYEGALEQLFDYFWFESDYSPESMALFKAAMHNPFWKEAEKSLLVSALTFNMWRGFSASKWEMLFDACYTDCELTKQRALVGVVFNMSQQHNRLAYYPHLERLFTLLLEQEDAKESLRQITFQIIRTSETKRINQKMSEEIIPELLKAQQELKGKFNPETLMEMGEEERNEWGEFMEQSGVGKTMQEMQELQMSGSDIYLTTFSALKRTPFFRNTHHWFLPFDTNRTEIASLFAHKGNTLINAFIASNTLCHTDKYSFCMALQGMSKQEQETTFSSMSGELEELQEMINENREIKSESKKQLSNQYIQDLYRYFEYGPAHLALENMFKHSLLLHKNSYFEQLFSTPEELLAVGSFYFEKRCFPQAVELLERVKTTLPSPQLFKQIGFCHQQASDFINAIVAYDTADLLEPDNHKTLKHLAYCARQMGDKEKALGYYERIETLYPEDYRNRLYLAHCLLDMNEVGRAKQVYAKLHFEYPGQKSVWKGLAWCYFVEGDYMQSERYWSQLLAERGHNTDELLNAGHCAFAQQNRMLALERYKMCMESCAEKDDFYTLYDNDRNYLLAQNIKEEEVELMRDLI